MTIIQSILVIIGIVVFIVWLYNRNQSTTSDTSLEIIERAISTSKIAEKEIEYDYHQNHFLKNKIGYFSQARDKEEANYISRLVAPDGKKSRWAEFRNKVTSLNPNYDPDILENEFNNFYGMAQCYQSWHDVQKDTDIFPYLKYDAVSDGVTCKTCKKLNNIIRPVNDPFWDTYFPPNCETCRCLVRQVDIYEKVKITDLAKKNLIPPTEKFALNVGKHELKLEFKNSEAVKVVPETKPVIISVHQKAMLKSYNPQNIQRLGLQFLETIYIIGSSNSLDTIKGRHEFLLSIIGTLKNGQDNSRYLSDIQKSIDTYKSMYYDRILQNYEISFLLKPAEFDLADFYCNAVSVAFSKNYEKHQEEIKALKRHDAKVRRVEKVKELIRFTKEELNNYCSTTHSYSGALTYIENIEHSLQSIDIT